MRLKAHFYLKKDTSNIAYAKHGLKTRNYTAQCKELQNFEKDLLDTIKLIKFYPSISEEILDNAILFAQQYIDIPEKD